MTVPDEMQCLTGACGCDGVCAIDRAYDEAQDELAYEAWERDRRAPEPAEQARSAT